MVTSIRPPKLSATFFLKGTFGLRPDAPAVFLDPEPPDAEDAVPLKPRTDLLLVGAPPFGRASFRVGAYSKEAAADAFGPIPESRRKRSGTYDAKWLRERWPWYPDDFDWSYFNSAPEDQRPEAPLRGDEEIVLGSLLPERPVYRSRLPGLRVRCFLEEEAFREVPLALDTLRIDAGSGKLVLVWRGLAEVRSLKLSGVRNLVLACERLEDPPRSPEEYRPKPEPSRRREARPKPEPARAEPEIELDAMDREFAAAEAEAAKTRDEIRRAAIDAGAEPSLLDRPVPPIRPEEAQRQVGEALAGAIAGHPEWAERLAVFRTVEAPEFPETRPETAADVPEEPPAPEWTRESVREAVARGFDFAEQDLAGLDLSKLDLAGARFARARLSKARLAGARLVRADLTRAELSRADLTGADLSEAALERADLSDARLSGAVLEGVRAGEADFTGASLAGAKFSGARLRSAGFLRADLGGTDFTGADLRAATLEEARGVGARFADADLTGLHASDGPDFSRGDFRRVRGAESCWGDAKLEGADFTGAVLSRADFAGAALRGAIFDGANLRGACFADADLEGARLRWADAWRGSFERAALAEADLAGSNFYEAEFWDARLEGTNLSGANVRGTKLS